jgi:DNA-binding transcriptional ArsR family regulator
MTTKRNRTAMPGVAAMERHASEAAEMIKALAHPARLLVMCRLVESEASVSELSSLTDLSMSALSQHLAVLRESGLVGTRREAQTIHYRIVASPALGVMQALHDAYCGPPPSRGRGRSG